jgi:hypothetical protein
MKVAAILLVGSLSVFGLQKYALASPGTCESGDCEGGGQQCCDSADEKWCCPDDASCTDTNACGRIVIETMKGEPDTHNKRQLRFLRQPKAAQAPQSTDTK